MTQLYYAIAMVMWICLYFGLRHTIEVIRIHAQSHDVCTRTMRLGQIICSFGVLLIGGLSTAGLHVVYTLHQVAVSGALA